MTKITRIVAWVCGFASAVLFIFGAFMSSDHPHINKVWMACAVTGMVGFLLQTILAFVDGREIAALKRSADAFEQHRSQRRISRERMAFLVEKLSRHAGQPYEIMFEMGDAESKEYAGDFKHLLSTCKWDCRRFDCLGTSDPLPSGVHVVASDHTQQQIPVVLRDVCAVLAECGIARLPECLNAVGPFKTKYLGIYVGRKEA